MNKRDFSILKEVISPQNVEIISELIAIQETKYLISFIGAPMIAMRNNLYKDLYRKNKADYLLSDAYDLVQECALFLCEHFGKKLSDVHHIDKKGRKITIETQALALECRINGMSYPEISRVIGKAISTSYDTLKFIQKRYLAIYD